ncbi:UDP-glucose 4-epimerase GalE [Dechloromonas denitrificans]|uniref:UDP-glucose 4-epimerase GalE n=1 Tax=Dechloromonas denitrificans TaxID=281362 RepID=UPI001CF8F841|nr:UDP-glucose 4-epimerase GalE [Dechloromonas denitrificans]UCV05422.1 UDP-glucose 4-epimerase GalE [Dechloromonas denitrificans]UCV09767.1 UDP-glucose 4-epimerase GalE [Dechloromonas denitrificans]
MKLLITGGAGYIGSHACVECMAAGYEPVVVDNFSNSHPEALRRVAELVGRPVVLVEGDVRDRALLRSVFTAHEIGAVVHFAGLKAVGESVAKPLDYYDNNVSGSLVLFETMAEFGVKSLVFSSSATVYGDPHTVPIGEDFPLSATNPYGRSKLMIEEILRDLSAADPAWRIITLRYFNPVGAHASGRIGEDPEGIPNNLLPYVSQVAVGRLPELRIFGNDYPTPDGTGVRDYIHVVDLAQAHVAALNALPSRAGLLAVNIGTGQGYSVLDMVSAFARASGQAVPYRIDGRRPGDIAACYADPSLAAASLGWQATRDIATMCRDAWNWQQNNPRGYKS